MIPGAALSLAGRNRKQGKRKGQKMKYEIEKALHEIIRDIPAAETADRLYKAGMITIEDALSQIALAIRLERLNKE